MRKISFRLGVAILTFVVGTAVSFINPFHSVPLSKVPLTVVLTSEQSATSPGVYIVNVTNVSRETISGYSLGHTCNCRSWDSDGNFYPDKISYMNPDPTSQVLRPGESQQAFIWFGDLPPGQFHVWVDLVHFDGKGNWGPNLGHKEGYVRE